jgi:hypothetical protein
MCSAIGRVRFALNSDRKSGRPKIAMSALDLKADVRGATSDVGYEPIADSCSVANRIITRSLGESKELRRLQGLS